MLQAVAEAEQQGAISVEDSSRLREAVVGGESSRARGELDDILEDGDEGGGAGGGGEGGGEKGGEGGEGGGRTVQYFHAVPGFQVDAMASPQRLGCST